MPNFSFEQRDTCPNTDDQIHFATSWSKYSSTITTPDYYNSCSPSNSFGIPKSLACYQPDHRNCNAYAGLITFGPNINDREHIGIQLNQPLVIGQKYFISFYTVMGEVLLTGNYYSMPSNNIGIRLSTIPHNSNAPSPIDNFAHLYSSAIINDSINWTRISGSIVADSAYNYLIVGNFFDDANTDTINYSCGSCFNLESYYFVDDICLSTDSMLANGGLDLLSCNVSINEIAELNEVVLYPNPSNGFINLSFGNVINGEIILFDIYGALIYYQIIESIDSINLNLSSFSSGCYMLKVINKKDNQVICKKIIKH